jgi:hypothetical protein
MTSHESETGSEDRPAIGFEHQCYLMHNWKVFLNYSQNTVNKGGFAKTTCLMHSNAAEFISKLMAITGVKNLFQGRTVDYANVVPKILIYKVTDGGNGKAGSKTLLRFSDHTMRSSIDSMFGNRSGRGDDVGLQSFDFTIGDPTAKGWGSGSPQQGTIRANLSFLLESAQSLFKERPGGYRYSDLFSHKVEFKGPGTDTKGVKDAAAFRIYAVVGWQMPPGKVDASNRKFANALQQANFVMKLGHKSFDIDFRENGQVELNLEYTTYVEERLASKEFDIFSDHAGELQALKNKHKQEADALDPPIKKGPADAEKPKPADNSEPAPKPEPNEELEKKKGDLSAAHDKAMKQQKQMMHQKIVNDLEARGKLFHIDVPNNEVTAFMNYIRAVKNGEKAGGTPPPAKPGSIVGGTPIPGGTVPGTPGYKKDVEGTSGGQAPPPATPSGAPGAAPAGGTAQEYQRVFFFYYGDLVDAALNGKLLNQQMEKENIRILLGPVDFKDPIALNTPFKDMMTKFQEENPSVANVADIPIAWDMFMKWYHSEFTAKDKKEMTVAQFIGFTLQDLVSQCISPECFVQYGDEGKQKSLKCTFEVLQVGAVKGKDRLGTKKRLSLDEVALQSQAEGSATNYYYKNEDVYHYVIVHAVNAEHNHPERTGNEAKDFKQGIYWFHMGASRGLFKSAKFTKNKSPELEKMQIAGQKEEGGLPIVAWQPYNATINLIGNSIIKTGCTIYINPAALGMGDPQTKGSPVSLLGGIGGYYLVSQVEHQISTQSWTTTVTAKYSAGWKHGDVKKPAPKPVPAKGDSRYEDNPDPHIGGSNIKDRKFSNY